MKTEHPYWGILAAFVALVLASLVLPPLPAPKMRASRVNSGNTVARASLALTNRVTEVIEKGQSCVTALGFVSVNRETKPRNRRGLLQDPFSFRCR